MPNGLLDPRGEMQATPRKNYLMGLLADALTAANDYAQKPDPTMPGGKANPVLGLLADAAGLQSAATTAGRVAYGEPLTNGLRGSKAFLKPETADVAMMAPISPRNALAALGLLGMADTGAAKAIFAGIGAKTADKAALAQAEKMTAAGADPRQVWTQTGWFKGGDGKWRFEIDDSGAVPGQRLYSTGEAEDLRQSGSSVVRRQKALLHPQLSAAYPDTKNIGVILKAKLGEDGAFNPELGNIVTGVAPNGAANRSTMLHELQHAIQMREGFATGGAPTGGNYANDPLLTLDPVEQQIKQLRLGSWTPEVGKRMTALNEIDRSAYGRYKRLAGEAEARAVQSRMNMSQQQRHEMFPFDSYDVPVDALIYK